MKLLFCSKCWDMFKLDTEELRQCKCGEVKGRYIDNMYAEVSENAISIAIGNGSLIESIYRMKLLQKATNNEAERDSYIHAAKIDYAWVRPNSGKGNPHTKVLKSDLERCSSCNKYTKDCIEYPNVLRCQNSLVKLK